MQALLLIDHGSTYKKANDLLQEVASLIQQKRPDLIVEIAHMELASPTIKEGISACIQKGATHIIAHPYMLSPGRHATTDIPKIIHTEIQHHPGITYAITAPLGLDPKIADVILDRMDNTR